MLNNANFLCEIGTEEIPAGYLPPAVDSVKTIFTKSLQEQRVDFNEIEIYATPRRIAILISDLSETQREEELEVKGPSVKAAYDDKGEPSKALLGFMRGNGVSLDNIFTKDEGKGEYIFALKKLASGKTEDIISEILIGLVDKLSFPKRMRWSDKKVTFPRPISYFMILFNDRVIGFEIEGIKSSNKTRGHYVQFNEMVEIKKISEYETVLESNGVILDQNKRKEYILKELYLAAEKTGGVLNDDEDLLNTVTYLVENPNIAICRFDKSFLEVPHIALIAEMREHQKYFSILDSNGVLMNYFLVTSNNPVNKNIEVGNERVISARFKDAQFFYNEDKKKKLIDRVDSLKSVLFHKELGSIYEKVERMKKISEQICKVLNLSDVENEKIDRALLLCKIDLNSAMVNEFASLQGKIGRIYAENDGEDDDVARAIEEHYKPGFHGDSFPQGMISVAASLCEKIDNIFGSFSVGNIPKGSQDPYALRRQAHAIVDIIIKNELNISIEEIFKGISLNYKDGDKLVGKIIEFISTRAKTIYSDIGFSYDEIDACLSTGSSDYFELFKIAGSINEFRKKSSFSELLLSFKRMNNIVAGFRKKNKGYELSFNESLLKETEEKELYSFFDSKKSEIKNLIESSNYIKLFELIISGKNVIDKFFDKVLVMDEDIKIRDNRLFLLDNILGNFTNLLDFSKIADKK